ncbi:NAD-dependent epimerase/dehydratase family protein [Patescibacteria group bacterium]|nr:MAG: NAD-dependent epimerase/dehydratase family protein [Patescibacteria group bacterium]
MAKTILVAGVNGFVGHHLARELKSAGHRVIGTGMDDKPSRDISDALHEYVMCDLTVAEQVKRLPLKQIDAVINLAGLASVGDSFKPGAAERYTHINVAVHTTIAEQLLKLGRADVRVIAISTGAVYDNSQPMPIPENGALIAQQGSPYAHSKIAMENALTPLRDSGLDVVIARPFNHIGPGQLPGFLVPDLITQLRATGTDKAIRVGRLDTKRDYTDVRDVARAYRLLAEAEHLTSEVYNICSGASHSGEEILSTLTNVMGLGELEVETNPDLIRPNDPADIRGDNTLLVRDTGWQPSIEFTQTLRDCVN